MNVEQAPSAIQDSMGKEILQINQRVITKGALAVHTIRNAQLQVLSGNRSPSPPGSPPGRRSGHLRLAWTGGQDTVASSGKGISLKVWLESGSYYAGYLEKGTSRMAARPFVDKIKVTAGPKIVGIYRTL